MHDSPRSASALYGWRAMFSCLVVVVAMTAPFRPSQAITLQIIGTDVPPLIHLKDGRVEGFCVDLVREIQGRIGDFSPIQILPWPRVMTMATSSPDILVVCPKKTESREGRFHWIGPVFSSNTYLYVFKDAPVRAETIEEAKALPTILVPKGSYSFERLTAMGFKNLFPTVGTGQTSLRMVVAGRASALVLEEAELDALLAQSGLPKGTLRPAYLPFAAESYLAFSQGTAESGWRPWEEALSNMKRDGTFERLYRQRFNAAPPAKLRGATRPAP